jgi:hypothetical protein
MIRPFLEVTASSSALHKLMIKDGMLDTKHLSNRVSHKEVFDNKRKALNCKLLECRAGVVPLINRLDNKCVFWPWSHARRQSDKGYR